MPVLKLNMAVLLQCYLNCLEVLNLLSVFITFQAEAEYLDNAMYPSVCSSSSAPCGSL